MSSARTRSAGRRARPRVVVTDHVFENLDIERTVLAPLGAQVELAPGTSEQELIEAVRESDAVMVCFASLTSSVIASAAAGGCKLIARYGIGYDNVDVKGAAAAGIVVTNVPDYCVEEVADHTIALLLAHARQVVVGAKAVSSGAWELPQKSIHRLRGRTLALIGLGAIGRAVAARGSAFGLRIVGFDPYADFTQLENVSACSTLEAAVQEADFVALHVPLTSETRHLINEDVLASMQRAPVLINTARGGLVDLDAALAALDSKQLSGLVLDVTEVEPLPEEHPLRSHPLAVVTPHIAFYSIEAQAELQERAAGEVARALRGEAPASPVNEVVLQ